nr:hypothetical protein [Tanacetum cinerariifolium]
MMQTSTTQEYPSLIDTFFLAHTVNREFLRDKDRRIYEEIRRLEAMETYTDDEINRLARGGKQRGHVVGVGRVLPARAIAISSTLAHDSMLNSLHKKVDFMMSIFKSDSKYSDMFSQFESGGASGSGGCGDEEEGADHQDDEDGDACQQMLPGPMAVTVEVRIAPPPHHVPSGCMGCFANQGKGKRKPNLGGRAAGRLNTRDKTRNLSLKEITDTKGLTQFDLRPHMESPDWAKINAGIQQHLQKAYNTNKAALKAHHWVIDPTTGTYNVEKIRRERPKNIMAREWDKYIEFWNDPRNIARAVQNRQNRANSKVLSQQGSRSLTRLRDEMTSTTQEYPSLIDTFFLAHTVNREFLRDKDRRIYFESGSASRSGGCGDEEEGADHQDDEDEDGDGDS